MTQSCSVNPCMWDPRRWTITTRQQYKSNINPQGSCNKNVMSKYKNSASLLLCNCTINQRIQVWCCTCTLTLQGKCELMRMETDFHHTNPDRDCRCVEKVREQYASSDVGFSRLSFSSGCCAGERSHYSSKYIFPCTCVWSTGKVLFECNYAIGTDVTSQRMKRDRAHTMMLQVLLVSHVNMRHSSELNWIQYELCHRYTDNVIIIQITLLRPVFLKSRFTIVLIRCVHPGVQYCPECIHRLECIKALVRVTGTPTVRRVFDDGACIRLCLQHPVCVGVAYDSVVSVMCTRALATIICL